MLLKSFRPTAVFIFVRQLSDENKTAVGRKGNYYGTNRFQHK